MPFFLHEAVKYHQEHRMHFLTRKFAHRRTVQDACVDQTLIDMEERELEWLRTQQPHWTKAKKALLPTTQNEKNSSSASTPPVDTHSSDEDVIAEINATTNTGGRTDTETIELSAPVFENQSMSNLHSAQISTVMDVDTVPNRNANACVGKDAVSEEKQPEKSAAPAMAHAGNTSMQKVNEQLPAQIRNGDMDSVNDEQRPEEIANDDANVSQSVQSISSDVDHQSMQQQIERQTEQNQSTDVALTTAPVGIMPMQKVNEQYSAQIRDGDEQQTQDIANDVVMNPSEQVSQSVQPILLDVDHESMQEQSKDGSMDSINEEQQSQDIANDDAMNKITPVSQNVQPISPEASNDSMDVDREEAAVHNVI